MKPLSIRLVKELYDKLKKESEKTGLSMNSIIIIAITKYLERS